MNKRITRGTRVAFSRRFLQNTAQHTGRIPFLRGKITGWVHEQKGPETELAHVRWDDGTEKVVHVSNLVREDQLHLEPS